MRLWAPTTYAMAKSPAHFFHRRLLCLARAAALQSGDATLGARAAHPSPPNSAPQKTGRAIRKRPTLRRFVPRGRGLISIPLAQPLGPGGSAAREPHAETSTPP